MAETLVSLMHCAVAEAGSLKISRVGVGVGVVLYDPAQKKAVGVHILAPDSGSANPENPAKYANTAIPHAIDQLGVNGAKPPFSVSITGGAVMPGTPPALSLGPKIVTAVKDALKKSNLDISHDQTGGSLVRNMIIDTETGNTQIEITTGD
ncbi:hypothetical protein ACFL9T_20185 [Thermodesulfobacteriota bacterium]